MNCDRVKDVLVSSVSFLSKRLCPIEREKEEEEKDERFKINVVEFDRQWRQQKREEEEEQEAKTAPKAHKGKALKYAFCICPLCSVTIQHPQRSGFKGIMTCGDCGFSGLRERDYDYRFTGTLKEWKKMPQGERELIMKRPAKQAVRVRERLREEMYTRELSFMRSPSFASTDDFAMSFFNVLD